MNRYTSCLLLSALICFVAVLPHSANAQTDTTGLAVPVDSLAGVLPDSLRAALPDSASIAPPLPAPITLVLNTEQLHEIDHQEFSDYVRYMPGFYPLDRAGFASAARGLIMGLSPKSLALNFRGRRIEDHLQGAPDLGWVPPEALSRVNLIPLPLEAPGARVDAYLRSQESAPPSSRIAVRDGFYGLGNVDFDLAQRISPVVILNAGGRVATFGGRLPNNEGYGLNLRGEIGFKVNPDLGGWAGVMQNRLDSKVPFAPDSLSHNRERYDEDLALAWKDLTGHAYGYEQKETYGNGGPERWQELGLILGGHHHWGPVEGEVSVQPARARWQMKGMGWKTTHFGSAASTLSWAAFSGLKATANLGLDVSDDFAPARHLGIRLDRQIAPEITFFTGATQHQIQPSRFEVAADYAPGTHFLPYDSTFYINPSLNVKGNPGLLNETYTTVFAGLETGNEKLSGSIAGFWRRVENPIAWQVVNDTITSYNAGAQNSRGILGWAILRPGSGLEFGATGSWLPLKNYERRLFPEAMGHAWAQYSLPLFANHLVLRNRTWVDFYGTRSAPVPFGWTVYSNDVILSSRISVYLLGVHLFWEVRNITGLRYDLVPGLQMMHKEEVWGLAWNFRN